MKNENENEFNNLVLFHPFNNTPQTHNHKDAENVVRYKYSAWKKSNQCKFLIKTVVFLFFPLIIALLTNILKIWNI